MTAPGATKTGRTRNRKRHPRLNAGERVRYADGVISGTGTVDAVTPDYAIIWVWTDGGSGRKMFLQGMGTIVESLDEAREEETSGT